MAVATITVAENRVVIVPFGSDALTPIVALTTSQKDLAAAYATTAGIYADMTAADRAAIGDIITPVARYDTKADADAALAGLSDGDWIEVLVDEDQDDQRTIYKVVSAALVFKTVAGRAISTQAEAEAGAINTRDMSPLSVAQAVRPPTRTEAALRAFPATWKTLRLSGYSTHGIGAARVVRTSLADITTGGYPASSYFRSLDRFMPNGSTDATNGGYWLLSETVITPQMLGAVADGSNNDTTALTNASLFASQVCGSVFFPAGTYKITSQIHLKTGVTYYGVGDLSVIACANGEINQFIGASISRCTIRDLKISVSVAGTVNNVAAVYFDSCTYCTAKNLTITGCSWSGVLINNSSYCAVRGCEFSGWRGTVQDSGDIHIYKMSSYNTVDGNTCNGGGYVGVFIQEPGLVATPSRNIVTNNMVGAHTAYGIMNYNVTPANSFCLISGNVVENITGVSVSGNSGAGIYVQGSGGTSVIGNTVRNCCISTSGLTLTPAGIAVTNITGALAPCVVSGNVILDIVNYFGIEIASSTVGTTVSGNSIRLTSATSATNTGIYINAASNCTVTGNSISCLTSIPSKGILLNANGTHLTGNVVSNNSINACGYAGIELSRAGSYTHNLMTISGNMVNAGGTSCLCYRMAYATYLTFTGNSALADTTNALAITQTTYSTYNNNNLTTSGTKSVTTSGACTGSFYGKSNYSGPSFTYIQNAGTGLIVELLWNAAPSSSNWAVGDRVVQSVPVVGNPKGWRCTVAGVPGTWVSEGVL